MTDRPILFSGPMVAALLDGRKIMTRRLARGITRPTYPGSDDLQWRPSPWRKVQPGDRLWVKEAWRAGMGYDDIAPSELPTPHQVPLRLWYEAGDPVPDLAGKLRPSIHMPRWASRLTLTVTATRVERLHMISAADAQAEGVECAIDIPQPVTDPRLYVVAFSELWGRLHGPGAWDANPEVVVLSFTVAQRNIDQ